MLAQREDLKPPTSTQDTSKTLEIYNDAAMQRLHLTDLVEDNASPHNNDDIRASHRAKNINIVGYHATAAEKGT